MLTRAVVWLGVRLSRHQGFRTGLLIVLVAFVAAPAVSYLVDRSGVTSGDAPDRVATIPLRPAVRTPNVYWFVLDEYGRNDQLELTIGAGNQDSYDTLEQAGLTASESSEVSYPRTHISIASTLEMDHLPTDLDVDEFQMVRPIFAGENATVETFRSHGYDFVYSDQGWLEWASCKDELADVCLPGEPRGLGGGELEQSLLDLTPVVAIGEVTFLTYTDPVSVLDRLDEARGGHAEPFFLFAHVLSPHDPWR